MLSSSFPFKVWEEMFKLGMQTSHMMLSSGEVIFHRSQMFNNAMAGKLSWTDPEFSRIWQEKLFANVEAYNSMSNSIVKNYYLIIAIIWKSITLMVLKPSVNLHFHTTKNPTLMLKG